LGAKAAEQYGKYIKNPNHFAQDEVRYVQLLFFGEKYQESLNLATSLVNKLNPADSKVFYMKRMQLYNLVQLEKWPEAVEAGRSFFANAVPQGSNYEVRDYTDYGQALQTAGFPEEAIAAYNKAIDLNPKNADLIRNLGDSYADAENFVKAAEYYQRLVDDGNHKSNDLFTLSNYYLGIASSEGLDAAVKADALAKSQKYIDEVDKLVPDNVQIVNQKAKIAKFREGDTNNGAALAAYNELLNILDKKEDKASYARYYKYAYNYMATYYFTKGDKATAKTYYQKWLEYDPENESLRNYVNSLK
jgi:tetratricopeptide (TPR) repeat protein